MRQKRASRVADTQTAEEDNKKINISEEIQSILPAHVSFFPPIKLKIDSHLPFQKPKEKSCKLAVNWKTFFQGRKKKNKKTKLEQTKRSSCAQPQPSLPKTLLHFNLEDLESFPTTSFPEVKTNKHT